MALRPDRCMNVIIIIIIIMALRLPTCCSVGHQVSRYISEGGSGRYLPEWRLLR
jgi:hypothetical protein